MSQGEEKEQKDSYINDEEAQSLADYIQSYPDKFSNSFALMSPFRTQSLVIKNTLQEREDMDEKQKNLNEVGAFDEFISQAFDTVVVSLCKTRNVEK